MDTIKPNHDNGMWKGAPNEGFIKAVKLRHPLTKCEKMLWEKLRNRQFKGLKFRRQHPIHLYIADFYCHKYSLIIEIDGEYHDNDNQILHDTDRTKTLEEQGCAVIRFTNKEVEENIACVLELISLKIEELEM